MDFEVQKPMTYNFIDPIREFELYIIFIQFGGNDIVSEENENINSQFNRIMNDILDLYDELNEFCINLCRSVVPHQSPRL